MWPAGHIWDENHVCTVCGKQGTDVASLRWSGVAARYSYSGKSVRPTPKVYDGDYQLTLSNNVTSARDGLLSWFGYWEPGMAAVEVQGSGDYYGRIRIEYRIGDEPTPTPTPKPTPTPAPTAAPTVKPAEPAPTAVTPEPTASLPCTGGDSCPGAVFADMPAKDHWAHDAIDWALVRGVTTGTGKTTFSPSNPCTREQIVTFLWRAAGSPQPERSVVPFTDVRRNFAYSAVCWAYEQGVTTGTSETAFSPDAACTREQVVTFLWRALGKPEPAGKSTPFADVRDNYALAAICWATEQGVTTGTSKTAFSPDHPCTRAHVVTFLYRAENSR